MNRKNGGQPKRNRLKKTVDLATFPELNPNPISEVDLDGQIYYLNPAARRLFPALKTKGLDHPWMADWKSVADFFRHRKTRSMLRQVTIDERCYQQAMNYVAGIQRVRIYGMDITAREQAEQALRASEERYRHLFNTIDEGFCVIEMIFDAEGRPADYRFLEVNAAFEKQTGLHEAQGKLMRELAPAHEAHWFEIYGKIALTGESARFVNEARALNRWYDVYAYRVGRPENRQVAILFNDISEHKRAEQALRAARDAAENEKLRLQAVMETLPVGVAITDAQGGNIQSNSMFESVWGGARPPTREVNDYVGYKARWLDTGKPVLPEEWGSAQAVQKGKSVVGQLMEIERFDGARGYVINSAAPVRDAAGKIVGAAVAIQDITELRHTQDALRESEEKYRQLMENVNDLVCEVDVEARYLFVNSRYEQVLGYQSEELLGKYVRDLIHPDDLRLSTPSFKKLVDGRTISRNEWRFKHKNGEWRWFECIAQTYERSPGDKRVVVISRDTTERKKREAELYRLNRTLRALSNIDQAMMRAEDESEYLECVCRIVVEDCGHAMVWIGYAEADEAKSVRPVAYAGFEKGYLDTLKITWADTERGRGPTGTAIRTGKPSACRNMLTDPNFKPWRDEALKRGYASSIVFPLMANGKAFGAITIYSKEPDPFSDDEVKLLSELADDLAFGITANRLRVAHARAEEALRASRDDLERTVAERTAELKSANARLRSLTHDIVSTQEEERRRVSRELHDEAGQALTALKLSLQMMQDEFPSGWATYRQHLGDAVVLTDKTLEHIRMLAQNLRPPALESAGLDPTLEGLCREFAHRTQIQINYTGTELSNLGPATICLYRLLQEALTNAARHGHATEIQVRLGKDAEHVCLSVEDNGQGFDTQKVLSEQGNLKSMGLIGMQERIKMVGGQLEIYSNPGCGTRLIAHVPLEAA